MLAEKLGWSCYERANYRTTFKVTECGKTLIAFFSLLLLLEKGRDKAFEEDFLRPVTLLQCNVEPLVRVPAQRM